MKRNTKIIVCSAILLIFVIAIFITVKDLSKFTVSDVTGATIECRVDDKTNQVELTENEARILADLCKGSPNRFETPACSGSNIKIIFHTKQNDIKLVPSYDDCGTIWTEDYSSSVSISENNIKKIKEIIKDKNLEILPE